MNLVILERNEKTNGKSISLRLNAYFREVSANNFLVDIFTCIELSVQIKTIPNKIGKSLFLKVDVCSLKQLITIDISIRFSRLLLIYR